MQSWELRRSVKKKRQNSLWNIFGMRVRMSILHSGLFNRINKQLFGVEPRSEADCKYPLDLKRMTYLFLISL